MSGAGGSVAVVDDAGAPGHLPAAPEHVPVRIRLLDPEAVPPRYAHETDAGCDLVTTLDTVIAPGERAVLPTGIAVAIPAGYVGLVHPRSGLAARAGLTVLNAPGTIDADYRGEIAVVLLNTDRTEPVILRRGDRIAQLVLQRVATARWQVVEDLDPTVRGDGGFGSTGGHEAASSVATTRKDS